MRRIVVMGILLVVLALMVSGVSAQSSPRSYLILANGNSLPSNLNAQVAAAGGVVTRVMPEIGMAVATSSNPAFASSVRGVRSVIPNLRLDWTPNEVVGEAIIDAGNPPNSGDDDTRFDLQWGHDAVNAPEAWNAGQRGQGAVVAVLDEGFDLDHRDFQGQIIDQISFVPLPGETASASYVLADAFSHGSHVAGTIAAADNGFGVIGVAPSAKLVLVKVLSEIAGSGEFDWVINGILYAANRGDVDIINMSLGGVIVKAGVPGEYTAREAAELRVAMSRATTYAYQRGVTIIASEGNDAIDKDHTGPVITLPADADHVISIAATTPVGWVAAGWDGEFKYPASYTNYGRSAVDFAAPGGDGLYPGNENCTVAGLLRPCWVFDLVFSVGSNPNPLINSYYWAAGTSMAAPHASGVAAIIVGEAGGKLHPAQVEQQLRARALVGGNTPFYGKGVVNTGY